MTRLRSDHAIAYSVWPTLPAYLRKYNVQIAKEAGLDRSEVQALARYLEAHPPEPPTAEEEFNAGE